MRYLYIAISLALSSGCAHKINQSEINKVDRLKIETHLTSICPQEICSLKDCWNEESNITCEIEFSYMAEDLQEKVLESLSVELKNDGLPVVFSGTDFVKDEYLVIH